MFSKPWQPLTPKGAAAFAVASFTRLYVVLLCFALATALAVVFFLVRQCVPVLNQLSGAMPEGAVVSRGEMFGQDTPVTVSGAFLSIDVAPEAEVPGPHAADLRILLHRTGWKACSVLGCVEQPLPRDATFALGPSHLGPKWAAWKPLVLLGAALATVVALVVSWTVLASLYWLPVWIAALVAGRKIGPLGSWKVSAAGLMPGCALMVLAIVLYALRVLDLPALAFVQAAHLGVGWIFLGFAIAALERKDASSSPAKANPFGEAPPENPSAPTPRAKKSNPFSAE
jgi:hypothetical protein